MTQFDLGNAKIYSEDTIVAGTYATIKYIYTVGHPIEYTGYIKIAFRHMDDFGEPQFDDPKAPNYISIKTSGGSRIIPRWERKGDIRPLNKIIFLCVRDRCLDRGEQVQLIFGDTSGGSMGWHMPTFCMDRFEFKTSVDPIANFLFKELPESPWIKIIADKPARLICIAPSEILVDQAFDYNIKYEDRWGNQIGTPQTMKHQGWNQPGICTIPVEDKITDFKAESNPIQVTMNPPKNKKFWADFHAQSGETIGSHTIEHYFSFGRDVAQLDIIGHQGNDFMITDDYWHKINQVAKEYYEPGKFVTFPGYEWSANTPVGGHRNIYFTSEGEIISRSSCDLLPESRSAYEDSLTSNDLYRNLKKQTKHEVFGFAHVGGNFADLSMFDEDIEVAVEVHSAWGTFEWFLREALSRGYRVGFVANSDGHKGDPGSAYPGNSKFGSVGGLTCVLAENLDRKSVYEALKARHCYATSGCRALLDVKMELGNRQKIEMGDIVEVKSQIPKLIVHLAGTAPIEMIDVFNGLEMIYTFKPFSKKELGSRIKILWNGARVRGQDRMLNWDGSLVLDGNIIKDVQTINFMNPNKPLKKIGDQNLQWESFTTGTPKGLIITLENPDKGRIYIHTTQINIDYELDQIKDKTIQWKLGELDKGLTIYRLPDQLNHCEVNFELPIENLKKGDNPIYVRGLQEDGFVVWSSPIYLINE